MQRATVPTHATCSRGASHGSSTTSSKGWNTWHPAPLHGSQSTIRCTALLFAIASALLGALASATMAEAAAEIHQLKSANEALEKQLKSVQEEAKVLKLLNQRGDAELDRLQQAVAASKDASVSSCQPSLAAVQLASLRVCRESKAFWKNATPHATK